jgi:uncharacterized protein
MRWIVFLPLLVVGLYLLIIFLVGWNMAHSLIHPKCLVPQTSLENHTHQEYWLPTEDGIEIRIWYYPSQNSAAVITFGGLNGSLGSDIPPVEALLEAGYGIVQVDSRACAQPSSPVTLGANEVYDAQAAFDFLRNRSEVDPDRIGAMGFSMGGATAIRLAARQPEIRSLVRDGGYASLADMFGQQKADSISARILRTVIGWIFHQQTGVDIHTIRPIDDLAQINPRPVLLIYGEMEAEPGLSQYQANGENSTLWIVPGGSHGKNHLVAPQEYQQRLLNFFNTTLLTVNPR